MRLKAIGLLTGKKEPCFSSVYACPRGLWFPIPASSAFGIELPQGFSSDRPDRAKQQGKPKDRNKEKEVDKEPTRHQPRKSVVPDERIAVSYTHLRAHET